jgi:tetratricopeptide (TPR) repeat protein
LEVIMTAKAVFGIGLSLALSLALMAQNAQELYQRGLVQEHGKGNLNEAIKLYSQAAKTAGKDRALAAKALIRIANSEEKRGHQAEAADAYAEVLRAYPEQRVEASLAQDRLNQLSRVSPAGARQSQTRVLTDVSGLTGPIFDSYCTNCHNAALNGPHVSRHWFGAPPRMLPCSRMLAMAACTIPPYSTVR